MDCRWRIRSWVVNHSDVAEKATLVGTLPGILPELPQCKGGRHVTGIPSLAIPTLRITNGPVGIGQNDCVSATIPPVFVMIGGDLVDVSVYTDPSSAKATPVDISGTPSASWTWC